VGSEAEVEVEERVKVFSELSGPSLSFVKRET
jgi:hypothetical protein